MHELESLFDQNNARLNLNHGNRSHSESAGLNLVIDRLECAACLFIRAAGSSELRFRLSGIFRLLRCAGGGWLLRSPDSGPPSYWLPLQGTLRRVSAQGHILEERAAEWSDFDLSSGGVEIAFVPPDEGWVLDAVVWKLDDKALIDELKLLTFVETQGYFLLGSHTRYVRPADVYRHLVHGWMYEDRYAWPHNRRICSENDAHALHLILAGLGRATGKRIYSLLKTQVLLAVISRQSDDGAFRHGEWTDGMESHFRLHCSAMHLMMDALVESDDSTVRAALQRAALFIAGKHDSTGMGAWFYHDELECSEIGMRHAPFKWWPGTALGKSPQNMLVLNTQLDTLVALDRYRALTDDVQYDATVRSGFKATEVVLALRPMEWLYRLVFSAINLTLLPTERATRLPWLTRMWKRIGWQVFIPRLPRLKTRFPRLVMPGGYIDRELSLQTWAYDYLAVNLMDLVRAARGAQRNAIMPYVEGVVAFCAATTIPLRWMEHKGSAYALGFYAEALYLLSLHEPCPDVDAALANALVLCKRSGTGLPPSLNGGNREAQRVVVDHAIPQPGSDVIVVANLSTAEHATCLIVNTGQDPVPMVTALRSVPLGWTIPATSLAPGGWARIEP